MNETSTVAIFGPGVKPRARTGFRFAWTALALAAVGAVVPAASAADVRTNPLMLSYYYNPNCRTCDAATALVKEEEKRYGDKIRVFYKDIVGQNSRKNATEFHAVLNAFKVGANNTPTMAVVVGNNEELLGGSDIILGKLPGILAERLAKPAPAVVAVPVTTPEPAPAPAPATSDKDKPEPKAVDAKDEAKDAAKDEAKDEKKAAGGDDKADDAPAAPVAKADDFQDDPDAVDTDADAPDEKPAEPAPQATADDLKDDADAAKPEDATPTAPQAEEKKEEDGKK